MHWQGTSNVYQQHIFLKITHTNTVQLKNVYHVFALVIMLVIAKKFLPHLESRNNNNVLYWNFVNHGSYLKNALWKLTSVTEITQTQDP